MRAISVDTQAVQRHRTTILECVKVLKSSIYFLIFFGFGQSKSYICTCIFHFQDTDASLRKRALELVFLLVNDTNAKPLTKELIDYLQVSDPDFKEDLSSKICLIVEK
jgi:AP-1 complex subunit gamma-1